MAKFSLATHRCWDLGQSASPLSLARERSLLAVILCNSVTILGFTNTQQPTAASQDYKHLDGELDCLWGSPPSVLVGLVAQQGLSQGSPSTPESPANQP